MLLQHCSYTVHVQYFSIPSIVFSKLNDSQGRLGEGQNVQNLGTTCTPILYTVFLAKQLTHIKLTVQDFGVPLFEDIRFSQLYARLSLTVELIIIIKEISTSISF